MEIALARYAFQALGTRCCLHVAGVGERRGEAFACAAADLLRAREARWSRFRPDRGRLTKRKLLYAKT